MQKARLRAHTNADRAMYGRSGGALGEGEEEEGEALLTRQMSNLIVSEKTIQCIYLYQKINKHLYKTHNFRSKKFEERMIKNAHLKNNP